MNRRCVSSMYQKWMIVYIDLQCYSCDITMQASSNNVDYKLLKLWPLSNTGAPRGIQSLTKKYIGTMFQNIFRKFYNARIFYFNMQASSNSVNSKFLNPEHPPPRTNYDARRWLKIIIKVFRKNVEKNFQEIKATFTYFTM